MGTIECKLPKHFVKLISEVKEGKIKIPTFQRDFVWGKEDIKFLLDSIYKNYPIGSFIFWKTDRPLDHHREICGRALKVVEKGSKIDYVLDGQQRITSLYAAVEEGMIDDNYVVFYFDLNKNCFDYINVDFDYNHELTPEQNKKNEEEIFEKEHKLLEDRDCVPLTKIFVEGPKYHKYIRTFSDEHQEKVDDLFERFRNYPFSIISLEDETDLKKVCDVFDRINNTGRKLSIVSLMIARAWAENFNLRQKLNKAKEDFALFGEIREVTLLQLFSTILNNKKCRSKDIKKMDMKKLEKEWDKIIGSVELAIDYLRQKFNIAKIDLLPFDAFIIVLSHLSYYKKDLSKYEKDILTWFWKASVSGRYSSTLEGRIEEDLLKFESLFNGGKIDFDYSIDWEKMKENITAQKYSLQNAFNKTILCLMAYQQPRDFDETGSVLKLGNVFSNYKRKNMHHVFPRGYFTSLKREYAKENKTDKIADIERMAENIESIVNIMFIPSDLNKRINDTEPRIYFNEFKELPNIEKVLQSHLIYSFEEFGLSRNDFYKFINMRSTLIEKKLAILTGRISKISDEVSKQPAEPLKKVEKGLRLLVHNRLEKSYGQKYWETDGIIPDDVCNHVENLIFNKTRRHPYEKDKYELPINKLNLCYLSDLKKIISKNKKVFNSDFPAWGLFHDFFNDLNFFRNPIAHNSDFNEVEELKGRAAILWFEKMLKKSDKKI